MAPSEKKRRSDSRRFATFFLLLSAHIGLTTAATRAPSATETMTDANAVVKIEKETESEQEQQVAMEADTQEPVVAEAGDAKEEAGQGKKEAPTSQQLVDKIIRQVEVCRERLTSLSVVGVFRSAQASTDLSLLRSGGDQPINLSGCSSVSA